MEELYARIIELVIKRLESFGVEVDAENEAWTLRFITENRVWYVLTEIAHTVLPEELEKVVADHVCGEYMQVKRSIGQLPDFEPSLAVKEISEGDVSVTYQDGRTKDQLTDWLIASLQERGRDQWSAYRKLRW